MARTCGVLLGLALALGCVAPPRAARPNVLLITVDTMRADRVGRAGLTPTLDALAARGTRFTHAYAHAPTTLASHASILTGRVPSSHGARNNGAFRLDDAAVTLPESLREAGYATGAFVSAFVLDSRFGLAQGFDVYDDRAPAAARGTPGTAFRFAERRAAETLAAAGTWIARQNTSWFAWVHLFDPHAPYAPPEDFVAPAAVGAPRTGYDAEIAYVDASIGRFLSRLQQTIDSTLVIVTADHGEGLGEHGESTHGLFAYDSTLRVPLIVAGPGVTTRVANEAVSHIDIMPTVLQITGAPVPDEAVSLVPVLEGGTVTSRPIYFEALDAALTRGWAPLTGVVADGWKYVELPMPELYDLRADADERTNRVDADAARATELRALTRRLGVEPASPTSTAAPSDGEARSRLRALGYVSAGASTQTAGWSDDHDPKRLLPLHTRFQKAADLAAVDPQASIRELRSLVDDRPDFAAAYEALATLFVDTGRPRDATALLTAARARGLEQPALVERLGTAWLAAGDARAAIAALEPLAKAEPDALNVLYTLALAYVGAGDTARGRDTLTTIVRIDPSAGDAWTNLGTLDLQRGAMQDAQGAFERALDHDERSVPALKGLGAALASSDPARAIDAWERAIALAPDDHALLARLAFLLASSDRARARPYLERLVREAPDSGFAAEKTAARRLLNQ